VLLKRLADAIADGDHICAVLKGSAINNDGSIKVGYTAPSVSGQVDVILEAQAMAGVDPDSITYVEAHGTGTLLGDPIEIAALTQAFRTKTERNQYCAIGSVKTNIGHLDTAAGISGFIKAALTVEHGQIPPSLHCQSVNPKLRIEQTPFFVNTELRDWKPEGFPRRAAVSSFGFGGTNAHAILEQAPAPAASAASRDAQVLLVSGRASTSPRTPRPISPTSPTRSRSGARRSSTARTSWPKAPATPPRRSRSAIPSASSTARRATPRPRSRSCSRARARSTSAWPVTSTTASRCSAPRWTRSPI